MKKDSDKKRVERLLRRGVERIIGREELEEKLLSGNKLRIKHGIDPTGAKIHIGRAVVLWKLKEFQDLGHKIVLIIGDFTAQVGDPSDKLEKRPFLSHAQIKRNLKTYLPQIGKIVNLKKAEIRYNSSWLKMLRFEEISKLSEIFTVQQMLERRNFQIRFKDHKEISLREFLYPIMQGYDSVRVKADLEIGGSDQLFNLIAGRKIQEFYGLKPQILLTTKMLEGLDGRKMSTSWGNVINILDEARNMFGKIMSLRDKLVAKYFELATTLSEKEIKIIKKLSPIESKERLAYEIVKFYHGEKKAKDAQKFFGDTFRKKKLPKKIPSYVASRDERWDNFLSRNSLTSSKGEARRLIRAGGIELDQKKITNPATTISEGGVARIGKFKFIKIKF
jgi:tyrosyl-tRNA synthetase